MCSQSQDVDVTEGETVGSVTVSPEEQQALTESMDDLRSYAVHVQHAADDLEEAANLSMRNGDFSGFMLNTMLVEQLRVDAEKAEGIVARFEEEGVEGLTALLREKAEEAQRAAEEEEGARTDALLGTLSAPLV